MKPDSTSAVTRRPGECDSGAVRKLLIGVIVNAIALWLTTLLFEGLGWSAHLRVVSYQPGVLPTLLTFVLVALVFGVVNGVIGTAIRIVGFPVYILTLGLIALVVNGLLLLLAAWITNLFGFGLQVGGFWWGMAGAIVLGIFGWLVGLILRPFGTTHH